jgi:aryl-alcohol dehydrogenase-like predicted oxidoreductase
MMQLKEEGKVRAIGVSNYSLEQLERAHKIYPVDSIQPAYSLLRRDIEKDLLPFCKKNQISVLVYSPLERGLLSGKVSMNRTFPEGDHRIKHPYFSPENRKIVLDALEKIAPLAKKLQVTLAQIISSCTLEMPGITAIIVGARNGKQAIENAQAGNLKLSKEDKDFIVQTLAEARSKLSMA